MSIAFVRLGCTVLVLVTTPKAVVLSVCMEVLGWDPSLVEAIAWARPSLHLCREPRVPPLLLETLMIWAD